MKRFKNADALTLLLLLLFASCSTEEPKVDDAKSITKNGMVLEVINKDNIRMYYEITSPTEVIFTNYYAFYGSEGFNQYQYSKNIVIPSTIKYEGTTYTVCSIASRTFANCIGLISVEIPNTIKSIGWSAFENCKNLKAIELPNSIETIESSAFKECASLQTIVIPNSVKRMEYGVFYMCWNIENIQLSQNMKGSIGESFFRCCQKLKTITIPDNIETIGEAAFFQCDALESVIFGSNLKKIEKSAFEGVQSLKSISIPNSCEEIAHNAFRGSPSLESIEFGEGLKTILGRSFAYCDKLSIITCHAKTPPTLEYAYEWLSNGDPDYVYPFSHSPRFDLYVPSESIEQYKQSKWAEFYSTINAIQ